MNEKFTQFKNQLYFLKIKPTTFKIACYLISCSKNGICFPSGYTIEKDLKITRKIVYECIKELEDVGFLLKENRFTGKGKRTSNCYLINEEYLVTRKEKQQVITQLSDELQDLSERDKQELTQVFEYDWLNDKNKNY